MFLIYQIINGINKESYIGFTSKPIDQRWNRHLSLARRDSKQHIHCAIRKYGSDNFKMEILEEGVEPEIGREIREPYWISVLKPEYNSTKGGGGTQGYKWSCEQREGVLGQQNALGTKRTPEYKVSQSILLKQRCGTQEFKEKMSKIMLDKSSDIGWRVAQSKRCKKSNPNVLCPVCGVSGTGLSMKRWHFNKCRRSYVID